MAIVLLALLHAVRWDALAPSDRLLADYLITLVSTELEQRVGDGSLRRGWAVSGGAIRSGHWRGVSVVHNHPDKQNDEGVKGEDLENKATGIAPFFVHRRIFITIRTTQNGTSFRFPGFLRTRVCSH